MSVLVVGSVAIDDVETPFGRGERVLGGSASYFSLSVSRFAPVRVVAVVGEDFPQAHIDRLASRGVDVSGIQRLPGTSFYWKGSYDRDLKQATTHATELGVFADFSPKLSPEDTATPYVFLANIHPALQLQVLDQVQSPRLTVLDTMNLWINAETETLREVLRRVDVALLNDEELRLLTGDHNLMRAARRLLEDGPRAVVIKKGEHGAFLRDGDHLYTVPAFPTEEVHDPTGAGDTFAGGFVGHIARTGDTSPSTMRDALARGAAMASFTVEGFSVEPLEAVTDERIAERLRALHALCTWDAPA